MEKLLKPIPQKHLNRVQQINKLVKRYSRHNFPVSKILTNTETSQMKKIKRAQKLNTEKVEVRELRNSLVKDFECKDLEMSHIYNEIRDSFLRTLSVKASVPLKRVIKKVERVRTSLGDGPDVPDLIRTKYSDLSTFFKQKTNTIATKQQMRRTYTNVDGFGQCESFVKWKQNSPAKSQGEGKGSTLKTSRLPKIKSRTHIDAIFDQIQEMIDKNMEIINTNLQKLHSTTVSQKSPQTAYDPEQIPPSNIIANYKPWSHQPMKKPNEKDIKLLGRYRRKSLSRVYQRQIFKLSVDTFKRDSFIISEQHHEADINIRQSMSIRDYTKNQSRFGKENKKQSSVHRHSDEIDCPPKTPLQHRRVRTQNPPNLSNL